MHNYSKNSRLEIQDVAKKQVQSVLSDCFDYSNSLDTDDKEAVFQELAAVYCQALKRELSKTLTAEKTVDLLNPFKNG